VLGNNSMLNLCRIEFIVDVFICFYALFVYLCFPLFNVTLTIVRISFYGNSFGDVRTKIMAIPSGIRVGAGTFLWMWKISARFLPSMSKKTPFWVPFFLVFSGSSWEFFRDFVKSLRDFSLISTDFSLIFTKSELMGAPLHLLHHCTAVMSFRTSELYWKTFLVGVNKNISCNVATWTNAANRMCFHKVSKISGLLAKVLLIACMKWVHGFYGKILILSHEVELLWFTWKAAQDYVLEHRC